VLQILLGGTTVRLDDLVAAALAGYVGVLAFDGEATGVAIKQFFVGRLQKILRDRGHAYDTVDAVLALAADDPSDALARCEALSEFRAARDDMEDLSVAYTRAKNLAKPELGTASDRALMGEQEIALADALDAAEGLAAELLAQGAYSALLETYAGLRGPIDEFFVGVMVMDPDPALRENRLRLLNRFVVLFGRFADFSVLAG
jgi:glycyl-tRNA synthetase beta chain